MDSKLHKWHQRLQEAENSLLGIASPTQAIADSSDTPNSQYRAEPYKGLESSPAHGSQHHLYLTCGSAWWLWFDYARYSSASTVPNLNNHHNNHNYYNSNHTNDGYSPNHNNYNSQINFNHHANGYNSHNSNNGHMKMSATDYVSHSNPQIQTPAPPSPLPRHQTSPPINFSYSPPAQDFQVYPKRDHTLLRHISPDKTIQPQATHFVPDIDYNHIKHISGDYHESFYHKPQPIAHPHYPQSNGILVNQHMYNRNPPHHDFSYSFGHTERHVHTIMVTDEELEAIIKQRHTSPPRKSSPAKSLDTYPNTPSSPPPNNQSSPHTPKALKHNKPQATPTTKKPTNSSSRPYSEFYHLNLTTTKTLPWYESLRR